MSNTKSSTTKFPYHITYPSTRPYAHHTGLKRATPTPEGIKIAYFEVSGDGEVVEDTTEEIREVLEWHRFAQQLTPIPQAEFEREMAKLETKVAKADQPVLLEAKAAFSYE